MCPLQQSGLLTAGPPGSPQPLFRQGRGDFWDPDGPTGSTGLGRARDWECQAGRCGSSGSRPGWSPLMAGADGSTASEDGGATWRELDASHWAHLAREQPGRLGACGPKSEIRAQIRPTLGCPQSEDFSPAGGLRTAPVATGAGCLCYRKEGRAKGGGDAVTRGRPLPELTLHTAGARLCLQPPPPKAAE